MDELDESITENERDDLFMACQSELRDRLGVTKLPDTLDYYGNLARPVGMRRQPRLLGNEPQILLISEDSGKNLFWALQNYIDRITEIDYTKAEIVDKHVFAVECLDNVQWVFDLLNSLEDSINPDSLESAIEVMISLLNLQNGFKGKFLKEN